MGGHCYGLILPGTHWSILVLMCAASAFRAMSSPIWKAPEGPANSAPGEPQTPASSRAHSSYLFLSCVVTGVSHGKSKLCALQVGKWGLWKLLVMGSCHALEWACAKIATTCVRTEREWCMSFWLLAKYAFRLWELCSHLSLTRCNTPCPVDLLPKAPVFKLWFYLSHWLPWESYISLH